MAERYATEGDLPGIVAILNAAIAMGVTAETEPLSVEAREGWFAEHNPGRYPIWVEVRQGIVAGWLSISQYFRQPAYNSAAEVSVYVASRYHRQGIASGLMRLALDTAPLLGLKTLVGYIWAHNEASLHLFESHGFERWGLLPRIAVIEGALVDTVIVGRPLRGRSKPELEG